MKLNITPGPWEYIRPKDSNGFVYVNAFGDTTGRTATCYDGDKFPDNAAAIVTAVNNTYHKGINPESVPEMIEALNKIISLPQTIGHAFEMQDIAKKIIQKATL